MSNVIRVPVPHTGVELQLDCGITVFVYKSDYDGVPVIEIVTGEAERGGDFSVNHENDSPDIRVMVNEGTVYGGKS